MSWTVLKYVADVRNPRDSRRWALAGLIARYLPRDVVLQAAKRMVQETARDSDPIQVAMLPLRDYSARWQGLLS